MNKRERREGEAKNSKSNLILIVKPLSPLLEGTTQEEGLNRAKKLCNLKTIVKTNYLKFSNLDSGSENS